MKIYGAGMAGLIAANILRRFNPTVFEKQESLPDNHNALLRFRSPIVSQASGVPFKEVWAQKNVLGAGECLFPQGDISDCNAYSHKVTGAIMPRSITNLKDGKRWIAPDNFLTLLASGVDVELGVQITSPLTKMVEPVISTLPMPLMMRMICWQDMPEFKYEPVTTIRLELDPNLVDVYQTIYFPHPRVDFYRASITGSILMVEFAEANINTALTRQYTEEALSFFGISGGGISDPTVHTQKFGKLVPIDESIRKAFILHLTQQYNIYSLGRFATWKQILLDDVVKDVEVIENLLTKGNYSASLQSAGSKQ